MWKPKYFHVMMKNRASRTVLGVGQPGVVGAAQADRASGGASARPFGWRSRLQTIAVMTSAMTYGAKKTRRRIARPRNWRFSISARPSANGIWTTSDRTTMKRVVADGAEEDRVGQRALEVGEPDEVVHRLEPVPVEEAVAGRLDDREQDEHGVQRQRREHEQPGEAPRVQVPAGAGTGADGSRHVWSLEYGEWAGALPAHSLLGQRMDYCLAAALMAWATDSRRAGPSVQGRRRPR